MPERDSTPDTRIMIAVERSGKFRSCGVSAAIGGVGQLPFRWNAVVSGDAGCHPVATLGELAHLLGLDLAGVVLGCRLGPLLKQPEAGDAQSGPRSRQTARMQQLGLGRTTVQAPDADVSGLGGLLDHELAVAARPRAALLEMLAHKMKEGAADVVAQQVADSVCV